MFLDWLKNPRLLLRKSHVISPPFTSDISTHSNTSVSILFRKKLRLRAVLSLSSSLSLSLSSFLSFCYCPHSRHRSRFFVLPSIFVTKIGNIQELKILWITPLQATILISSWSPIWGGGNNDDLAVFNLQWSIFVDAKKILFIKSFNTFSVYYYYGTTTIVAITKDSVSVEISIVVRS